MHPAPDPDERPRVRRRTTRILVIDDDGSVLLWHDSDPGADGTPRFWITTGGGVDEGESDRAAGVRELREETGLTAAESELVGPLAERVVVHGYSDKVVTQEEVYFAVRRPRFDPDTTLHTDEERVTFHGHRWWTAAELDRTAERTFPAQLAPLVRAAATALDRPMVEAYQMIELPTDEESTVGG